jgi:ankyrin repeat protein
MRNALCILTALLLLPACGRKQDTPASQNRLNAQKTAFLESARLGDITKMKSLIAKGADVNVKGKGGTTALHWAVFVANEELARLLIANGVDVNAKDAEGMTAFQRAAFADSTELMKILLAAGANINSSNNDDRTALHSAVFGGNRKLAEFLIANGADVNIPDRHGFNPLDYCVEYSSSGEMESILRNNGAELTKPWRTELMTAASIGYISHLEHLLKEGLDIHIKDTCGQTALHKAADSGREKTVEFLIANGANVNERDDWGRTSLWYTRYSSVAEILLAKGADTEARDVTTGSVALHRAAANGDKELAKVLLAGGAYVNSKNKCGETPLDMAESEEMKKLLRSHGAVSGEELREREEK